MPAAIRNRLHARTRVAVLAISLLLPLGGCGGCRRSQDAPASAPASSDVGSAAAPAIPKMRTRPPGAIRAGGDFTPAARISPPTPMAKATFAAAESEDAPPQGMDEPDEQPADEPPDFPEPDADFGEAAPGEPNDCIVIIDADPDFGEPPLTVHFSVETQCDAPPAYSWDFGDQSPPSSQPAPVHVYQAAGEYTVRLTATGPDGTQATDEIDISVEALPEE